MLSQLRPCCIVVKGFTHSVSHYVCPTCFGSSLWHGSKGCLVLATDITRPSLQKGRAALLQVFGTGYLGTWLSVLGFSTMAEIPVEALAVADADPAVAPVAAAVSAEVSGEPVGVSLLDAVAAGRLRALPRCLSLNG